jgi:hypothetical protein
MEAARNKDALIHHVAMHHATLSHIDLPTPVQPAYRHTAALFALLTCMIQAHLDHTSQAPRAAHCASQSPDNLQIAMDKQPPLPHHASAGDTAPPPHTHTLAEVRPTSHKGGV